jgi:hypothetical protein
MIIWFLKWIMIILVEYINDILFLVILYILNLGLRWWTMLLRNHILLVNLLIYLFSIRINKRWIIILLMNIWYLNWMSLLNVLSLSISSRHRTIAVVTYILFVLNFWVHIDTSICVINWRVISLCLVFNVSCWSLCVLTVLSRILLFMILRGLVWTVNRLLWRLPIATTSSTLS